MRNNEWQSSVARNGLNHKGGMVGAVIVAFLFDWLVALVLANLPVIDLPFEYTVLLAPIVLVWYILTELGSIIENIGLLGAPVPPFLTKIIKVLYDSTEAVGNGLVGKEEETKTSGN